MRKEKKKDNFFFFLDLTKTLPFKHFLDLHTECETNKQTKNITTATHTHTKQQQQTTNQN